MNNFSKTLTARYKSDCIYDGKNNFGTLVSAWEFDGARLEVYRI